MTLEKVRKLLAKLASALKLNHKLLARAQRRYAANRKRAFVAHNKQVKFQKQADVLRAEGHLLAAERKTKAAGRQEHIAVKNHARAQHYLGVVKSLQQRIHGLHERDIHLQEELKRLDHVTVNGNKVSGGTPRERLRKAIHTAADNCSTGHQHNYYSMTGELPDLGHTLTGMPYEHRFDCSSFATGIHFVCEIADPNGGNYTTGETMYTGSLLAHCETISRSEVKTGDFVVYLSFQGDTTGHHVEVVDDPARETTIGHGSAPIDRGVFNLFGDGLYVFKRNPALKGS